MYSLGLDIGSSSIKIALVDLSFEREAAVVRVPETEMSIQSPVPHWAEQDPDVWWHHSLEGIKKVIQVAGIKADQIQAIGIAYQMHGLVLVDSEGQTLRPAIIWCDSRAIETGKIIEADLKEEIIKKSLYNLPGNFTASKLKWVMDHEPDVYAKVDKIMLPGDYIALCMSGEATSTYTGMSEGVFFDFDQHQISQAMLEALGTKPSVFPRLGGSFDTLAKSNDTFEKLTGIRSGTPISYRAGDQPNNAFSLGVLSEGEAAATGGTSGVIYTVSKQVVFDDQNRVNTFAHVNHKRDHRSFGTLLCINGTGILYNWLRGQFFPDLSYTALESIAAQVQSEGILFLPFGNGAERMLGNQLVDACIKGLDFNLHDKRHVLRAGLEGIAFAFVYGLEIMEELGIKPKILRVGNDNLFQSNIFSQTLADAANVEIAVYETTGAVGAAKGAAYGAGLVNDILVLHADLQVVKKYLPESNEKARESYLHWKNYLNQQLDKTT
ncbi:MAG: carbohydrate kinase [Saprospiraceae bacterium]|nr:carbohydrate kinase [Saprospiraceae bacterium]